MDCLRRTMRSIENLVSCCNDDDEVCEIHIEKECLLLIAFSFNQSGFNL